MAATTAISPSAADIVVTREDQEKINRFAQLSAQLTDLTEMSKRVKGELQTIEDLVNEIEMKMLEEDDEDENGGLIDMMCGESFIKLSFSEAQKWIDNEQTVMNSLLKKNVDKIDTIRDEMNTLKAALYSKFGRDNIHLESDD
jgi:chaperonin cofactor prefoldin